MYIHVYNSEDFFFWKQSIPFSFFLGNRVILFFFIFLGNKVILFSWKKIQLSAIINVLEPGYLHLRVNIKQPQVEGKLRPGEAQQNSKFLFASLQMTKVF